MVLGASDPGRVRARRFRLPVYRRSDFTSDLVAACITAILLVPQAIAFALLAGLPPEAGLYASILPPLAYALLGTSRMLSVGPVSVAAIMVASALSAPEVEARGDDLSSALVLAMESGLILLAMAALKMGTLINFVSHPVLTGFTSGAAVLIIANQLPGLLGLESPPRLIGSAAMACLAGYAQGVNGVSAAIGLAAIGWLWWSNQPLSRWLVRRGLQPAGVAALTKSGPLLVVAVSTLAVSGLGLEASSEVLTVGAVPAGLPQPSLGFLSADTWALLLPPAVFISLIGYVESVAIAKVTARLRRQRIDANRELAALGAANMAAAFAGGMPVAGGFSRTMVNFSAGAQTQMAGVMTAGLVAVAACYFTPWFAHIPKATLAAIILVAILPLLRLKALLHTFRFDRADGAAQAATFAGVLGLGLEAGLGLGIVLTLLGHLWRTSKPHIAVVGRVPGTEHFRNIRRHQVETWPGLLLVRVDESLSFANAGFVEEFIGAALARRPEVQHVVLIATSINHVDATALEALESLALDLRRAGVTLHLSEVKGPVLDALKRSDLIERLAPGRVYFRTEEAVRELADL